MTVRVRGIFTTALTVITLSSVLSACGGGGGGAADTITPAASAEGVYGGTLTGSTSSNFQLLVLENDEFWSLYGTQSATTFFVAGFAQGPGASTNGTYTSAAARDYGFNPALSGSVSATYNADSKTITGTIASTAGSVRFTGGPVAGSLYTYNTSAQLSTVSGNWSLTALTGETVTLSLSATGAMTASTSLRCNFTGSINPRPSGKNVFNVTLTFGPSPCVLPGQVATGIAIAYPLSNGRTQLVFAGANSGRTLGTAAFGTR